jgi:hypothetical protein
MNYISEMVVKSLLHQSISAWPCPYAGQEGEKEKKNKNI